LTLAIGYDKARPRRLVRHFVDACRQHFADAASARYIIGGPSSEIPAGDL
jgi:hypothetical protein